VFFGGRDFYRLGFGMGTLRYCDVSYAMLGDLVEPSTEYGVRFTVFVISA